MTTTEFLQSGGRVRLAYVRPRIAVYFAAKDGRYAHAFTLSNLRNVVADWPEHSLPLQTAQECVCRVCGASWTGTDNLWPWCSVACLKSFLESESDV